MAQPRLNLKNVTSLLVDRDNFTRGLIAQMLRGFGMEPPLLAGSGAEAKAFLESSLPDILFLEGALPDMTAAELIGWIRRQSKKNLRFVPIIVLSGYTQLRMISMARDGGANIVLKKPISPQTLFDRILWVARTTRPFLETSNYVGPDRRFHDVLPPDGQYKREFDAPLAQEA